MRPPDLAGPAELLQIDTPALFQEAVTKTVQRLSRGEVAALPTETVYGLAANAWNREAVSRIYEAKGRPAHNPLIVHVSSFAMARACVSDWPERAAALARSFWPGPLTMVLPKSSLIPHEVTGGGETVAIRWPGHPFMRAVIEACGFPLAAPSANRSNELSPTTARHVLKSLGHLIPLIVDGGPCQVGIESTVVDLGCEPPRILRPGIIPANAIGALDRPFGPGYGDAAPPSPGMLAKHYSPKARLALAQWSDTRELERWVATSHPESRQVHIIVYEVVPSPDSFARVSLMPNDAEAYARALYICDELGADLIVVERPPDTPDWVGVLDRLQRGCGAALAPVERQEI